MKFDIILMDIPWTYKDKNKNGHRGAESKYPCMSLEEIKNLPINNIASDNCVLFLWATFPLLQEALDVIKAYGFKYKTLGFNFIKTNKKAKDTLFMGLGHWTRQNAEICLLATKGKPKVKNHSVHSIIIAPIEKHSAKPSQIQEKIVQLMGDLPRIEIFARKDLSDKGWICIGNEITGNDINTDLQKLINQV